MIQFLSLVKKTELSLGLVYIDDSNSYIRSTLFHYIYLYWQLVTKSHFLKQMTDFKLNYWQFNCS